MTKLRSIGLTALIAVAALAVAQGTALKKTGKVGDSAKYHLEASFSIQGTDGTFAADMTDKVTDVDKDGNITMETSTSNQSITIAGNQQPIPDTDPSTTQYSPTNEPLKVTDPSDTSGAGARIAALMMVKFPDKALNVGDKWEATKAADSNAGFVDAKYSYTVDSTEKIGDEDTLKIKVSNEETGGDSPAKADGFIWIDAANGWLVKSDLQVANFPTPQGPIDMHVVETKI